MAAEKTGLHHGEAVLDRVLTLEVVRVTERAAVAAKDEEISP